MQSIHGSNIKSNSMIHSETSILIVERNDLEKILNWDAVYKMEALEIADFLKSVFAGKTLKELKELL